LAVGAGGEILPTSPASIGKNLPALERYGLTRNPGEKLPSAAPLHALTSSLDHLVGAREQRAAAPIGGM
jgi:hypothetical protein